MKVTKGTIVRTVMLCIVVVNLVLKACGKDILGISEDVVYSTLETLIEIAVIAVAWWKNNSFSSAAIKADDILQTLKESE